MSEPEDRSAQPEPAEPGASVETLESDEAVTALREEGDVEGLLALARAYQTGTPEVERDLARCLQAFEAAAGLGDAEAEYCAAVFYLSGGVVEQDVARGVSLLRSAAKKEHVKARVYLGNIYELGIHYDADSEKASMWYRSAARAAGVHHDPGTPEYRVAMAELGAAREVQALLADDSVPSRDKVSYLKKAKPLGYGEYLRRRERLSQAEMERTSQELTAAAEEEEVAVIAAAEKVKRAQAAADRALAEDPAPSAPTWTAGAGLGAFLLALVLFGAAISAGWLATEGARSMLADGGSLPLLGDRVTWLLPLSVTLFGVLPSLLLYRARTVVLAAINAVLLGGTGWILWGAWRPVLAERMHEGLALGIAGFLIVLLVLGIRGGTRKRSRGEDAPAKPEAASA